MKAISLDATKAFQHPENKLRFVESHSSSSSLGLRPSREDTPPVDIKAVNIRLSLREREKPYDPHKGFVFGSAFPDEHVDILLNHEAGIRGVSRTHFAINFNWSDKSLYIQNMSRLGTILETGVSETCLYGDEKRPISSGNLIRAGYIVIQVVFPQRKSDDTYLRHLKHYRQEVIAATPRLEAIVRSDSTIETISESDFLSPIGAVGKGKHADVYQAVSVSGEYFAVKVFVKMDFDATIKHEIDIISAIDHVSTNSRKYRASLI